MNTQTDLVPAVYTTDSIAEVSAKYRHIKTIDVVNYLTDLGWIAKGSSNFSCRDGDPVHCKHFVRLSKPNPLEYSGVGLNLTVVNSHDRSIPFRLLIGFMRADSTVPYIASSSAVNFMNMRHIGKAPDHIKENIIDTLSYLPTVATNIEKMMQIQVTDFEIRDMAVAIADIRWPGKGSGIASLICSWNLSPVNYVPRNLFDAYCLIQSRVILGGYRMITKGTKRTHMMARPIKSFKRQVAIGQACWAIAMNILSSRNLLDVGSLNTTGENVTW